jgi:hypothetical protein
MNGAQRQYRDPRRLTQWLGWLLITAPLFDVLSDLSEISQLQLLVAMRDGGLASEAEMVAAAEANDLRVGIIAIISLIVLIITIVLFAVWIHRINSNIHAFVSLNLRSRQDGPWAGISCRSPTSGSRIRR